MTCVHVLGLIDAGPFADYPHAQLDAAQHARQCATCGPALQAATALATDLAALPEPVPPPELASTILARIARIQAAQSAPVVQGTSTRTIASATSDWASWATTLGSVGAALAIVVSMVLGDEPSGVVAWPRVGGTMTGLVAITSPTTWTLVLAASLALYVAGLLAPLRGKGPR